MVAQVGYLIHENLFNPNSERLKLHAGIQLNSLTKGLSCSKSVFHQSNYNSITDASYALSY